MDTRNTGGDGGDDVGGDRVSAGGELLPGDVRAHYFGYIARLHIVQVGHIYHHLVHCHASQHRAV